jgi:hypothetical protein
VLFGGIARSPLSRLHEPDREVSAEGLWDGGLFACGYFSVYKRKGIVCGEFERLRAFLC